MSITSAGYKARDSFLLQQTSDQVRLGQALYLRRFHTLSVNFNIKPVLIIKLSVMILKIFKQFLKK